MLSCCLLTIIHAQTGCRYDFHHAYQPTQRCDFLILDLLFMITMRKICAPPQRKNKFHALRCSNISEVGTNRLDPKIRRDISLETSICPDYSMTNLILFCVRVDEPSLSLSNLAGVLWVPLQLIPHCYYITSLFSVAAAFLWRPRQEAQQ